MSYILRTDIPREGSTRLEGGRGKVSPHVERHGSNTGVLGAMATNATHGLLQEATTQRRGRTGLLLCVMATKREGVAGQVLPALQHAWSWQGGCNHECGGCQKTADGSEPRRSSGERVLPRERSGTDTETTRRHARAGQAEHEGPPVVDLTTTSQHVRDIDEADSEMTRDDNDTAWDASAGHSNALSQDLWPGTDMRTLARESSTIPWKQLECWLPSDFESLRFAAGARNMKNMRMWLSHILSTIQILQTALAVADGGAATWNEQQARWQWSQRYVNDSFKQRTTLFAWHCVTDRAHELAQRWDIDRTRVNSIQSQLAERLGLGLVQSRDPKPDIFARVEERIPGRASILTRVELVHFQRRALLALPGEIGLHRALKGALCGQKSRDGCWLLDCSKERRCTTVFELPDWDQGPSTLLYMQGEVVIGIFCHRGLKHEKPRRPASNSRFIAEQVNWKARKDGDCKRSAQCLEEAVVPSECKSIPDFDVTRVAARANTWIDRLPDIGMATKVILEGRLALPLRSADVKSFDIPNLPTCDQAPDVIDALVAEYLICGVLEYCPPGHEPHCISPLGLVPKKTAPFYRLIVDLRKVNEYHADWKTHMSGVAANAMAFNPGAVAFSRDLKSAYLLSALGGCQPGLHNGSEPKRMKVPGERRRRIGCDPETCLGGCNKSFFGIRWRDQLYRYASPCFGSKHGGNVLETLITPVVRKIKTFGCEIISWVDDWLIIIQSRGGSDHNPRVCGGENTCPHCKDTFLRAREIEKRLDTELDLLGLLTSEKEAPPSQQGEFLGLMWDTVKGSFIMAEEKARSLAAQADTLQKSPQTTPRELAKWRGKLQWFAPCLEGTRILTRAISKEIGAPDEEGWDLSKSIGNETRDELAFWASNLPAMAGHAKPMWRLSPQELLRRFKKGEDVVDSCLSTDASHLGWGAILERATERHSPIPISGRWGVHDDSNEQAHREACGTVRAVEAFLSELQGSTVLHLTDCIPVAQAMEKGSANSKVLHRLAVELWRLCAKWSIHLVSMWIPGDEMVTAGVDELSREATTDKHDVRVSDTTWTLVEHLTKEAGMKLHVDWFADPHNHKLTRFWSRCRNPGSEGANALSAPSWGRLACKSCNQEHDQGAWLFPPIPLINLVITKLKTDRAHGVILVPHRPDSTWWTVLRAACGNRIRSLTHDRAFSMSNLDEPNSAYTAVQWRLCCFDFAPDLAHHYVEQCTGKATMEYTVSPEDLGHRRYLQSLKVFSESA